MTTYQFWSGLKTIGGNIIEVKTDHARVLCDFGVTASDNLAESGEGLSELENVLRTKQLPLIPEVFETQDMKRISLASVTESSIETAIFISHLHLDHMGGLQYLPKEATVYLSRESLALFYALVEVGEEDAVKCQLLPFDYGQPISIGDIRVVPKAIDHDTVGAAALFIETNDLKLIHSGDIRLNGKHPQKVWDWAEEARKWQPDVLLLEGTAFSFEEESGTEIGEEENKRLSEQQLIDEFESVMKTEKSIVFNPYIRNLERLFDVNQVACLQGRTVVWEESYAKVLKSFYPKETFAVLQETAETKGDKKVSLANIKKSPELYVLQNSYKNLSFLKELPNGVYLHSNGEPLGEYDSRYKDMLKQVEDAGFRFCSFEASGHASREELIKVAKHIQAKKTVPWHTFRPEAYGKVLKENDLEIFLPTYDTIYTSEVKMNQ